MIKVKICGLTNLDDALAACGCGADLLGFLFAEESPRCIKPSEIRSLIKDLPGNVGKVGLFKDHTIEEVMSNVLLCRLDHVQLHGTESPAFCHDLREALRADGTDIKIIKTFKVKDRIMGILPDEYQEVDYYLFDTYHPEKMGGTGVRFDWSVIKAFKGKKPVFIAGGLDPDNVGDAVRELNPHGVDVASGVERSVGKKDIKKIKEFIRNAKKS